ncbi:hypothetical protein NA78x_001581 [Anatilimnocola sp. NA78]|uniref:hypothetical protein n=1 Tax=Anatilimnocola sp. NA78 TaxID=3415683 RepID=UPI003CE58EAF
MKLLPLLKYFLALLSLGLIIGWGFSLVYEFGYFHRTFHPQPMVRGYVGCGSGSLHYSVAPYLFDRRGFVSNELRGNFDFRRAVGTFYHQRRPWFIGSVPICCVLTVLLPLAIGLWNRFRFSFWMYVAWTGLIAAQVAWFGAG